MPGLVATAGECAHQRTRVHRGAVKQLTELYMCMCKLQERKQARQFESGGVGREGGRWREIEGG